MAYRFEVMNVSELKYDTDENIERSFDKIMIVEKSVIMLLLTVIKTLCVNNNGADERMVRPIMKDSTNYLKEDCDVESIIHRAYRVGLILCKTHTYEDGEETHLLYVKTKNLGDYACRYFSKNCPDWLSSLDEMKKIDVDKFRLVDNACREKEEQEDKVRMH